MHLILTGATGLVGSACLHYMLITPAVTKVSVLSRRPVPMVEALDTTNKVNVIIHKDFNTYPPEILEQLKGAEGCVWAQGISYTDVSADEYENITVKFPLVAAKAFSPLSTPFKFVYVSGEGATTTPGFMTKYVQPFAPAKGRAEASLLALSKQLPGFKPYSLRPGGVYAGNHSEIQPYIPVVGGLKKVVYPLLYPPLLALYPSMMSPTRDLGRVLVELAMGNGEELKGKGIEAEGRTISNFAARRLADESR